MKIIFKARKIMEEKKLSPYDIAPYMNISIASIYRIFQNRRVPDLEELYYFSKVLDVPPEELYEYDESDEQLP